MQTTLLLLFMTCCFLPFGSLFQVTALLLSIPFEYTIKHWQPEAFCALARELGWTVLSNP